MELIDNLCDLETSLGTNIHHEIMALSGNDTSLTIDDYHQPQPDDHQLPINFTQHIQSFSQISDDPNHDDVLVARSTAHLMNGDFRQETGKGKSLGGRKRKNSEKDGEKLKEVIHVRAKRGQATDSHSLAERLRREKINERLRCLQNLVPGCYKTMGMAVMLDVVCSYVQSLQNQIEFLSMKLSAASAYYDFNTPGVDAVDAMQQQQGTSTAYPEVQEMVVRPEGHGGLPHYNNATWPI